MIRTIVCIVVTGGVLLCSANLFAGQKKELSHGKKVMAEAAKKAGCTYQAFDQMSDLPEIYRDKDKQGVSKRVGICWGLAVTWLEYQSRGDGGKYVGDLNKASASWNKNLDPKKNLLDRSWWLWIEQNRLGAGRQDDLTEQTGLVPAFKDDKERQKSMEYRGPGSPANRSEMSEMSAWIAKAAGTRYFLIHVGSKDKGHTMAAVGSKLGSLRFFDPNGGIVTAKNPATLATFFDNYFADKKINGSYAGFRTTSSDSLYLSVHKYKKK